MMLCYSLNLIDVVDVIDSVVVNVLEVGILIGELLLVDQCYNVVNIVQVGDVIVKYILVQECLDLWLKFYMIKFGKCM